MLGFYLSHIAIYRNCVKDEVNLCIVAGLVQMLYNKYVLTDTGPLCTLLKNFFSALKNLYSRYKFF